jgi:ABC-type glycerol-3-phosphate transport system permease component
MFSLNTRTKILRTIGRWVLLILLLSYTLIVLGPFIWSFIMSFRPTQDILQNPYGLPIPPIFSNYLRAITQFGFDKYIRNSVFVTGAALLIVTPVSAMAAYVFGRRRYNFRMRELLFQLIFVSIMFPPQITLLSLYILLWRYKLLNLTGLALIYAATALPISIYILRAFFGQIPRELEDAARIDGASDWQTFWRVMFPIARPAVATVIVLNFINFWNEFLYAVTIIHRDDLRTLPLGVMRMMGDQFIDYGGLSATLIISIAPVIVLYIFLSEWFIKGMTAGALKG